MEIKLDDGTRRKLMYRFARLLARTLFKVQFTNVIAVSVDIYTCLEYFLHTELVDIAIAAGLPPNPRAWIFFPRSLC